ncbi:DUF268 domain-containing protein [Leptolyngbya sp. KIOST-1]|uniref:DUF268 domain-containing protein n=1 Tax=Leptolyngbya sp. KIOST-1 TaxID=1229172 RepID=UPI00056866FC|nr:DUF268 domain-containing protein [Leptolyngbya sp. KIOST-1]
MLVKQKLIKINFFLSSQCGFEPLRLILSLRGLPKYLLDWMTFRKRYNGELRIRPYLNDRFSQVESTKSEYFLQDLIVAREVHNAKPVRHVDVGSRVDGFVAHVASFRELEAFDVRLVRAQVPGIIFRQLDLMDKEAVSNFSLEKGYCDSLSCLHALEHFGLGRYGDPINPDGYKQGFQNMASLLKSGGQLYLSVPIGRQRVEFNGNWVFDPKTILNLANAEGLKLEKLIIIKSGIVTYLSEFNEEVIVDLVEENNYSLGIFFFSKS